MTWVSVTRPGRGTLTGTPVVLSMVTMLGGTSGWKAKLHAPRTRSVSWGSRQKFSMVGGRRRVSGAVKMRQRKERAMSEQSARTTGIIGVGAMGGAMARCLLRKGYQVTVRDIVPER